MDNLKLWEIISDFSKNRDEITIRYDDIIRHIRIRDNITGGIGWGPCGKTILYFRYVDVNNENEEYNIGFMSKDDADPRLPEDVDTEYCKRSYDFSRIAIIVGPYTEPIAKITPNK